MKFAAFHRGYFNSVGIWNNLEPGDADKYLGWFSWIPTLPPCKLCHPTILVEAADDL